MLTKHVTVANRVAKYSHRDGIIVCGNTDYKIAFTFDSEWDSKTTKYARFIWNGMYKDIKFSGTECSVPVIQGAKSVEIGICSGDPENLTEDDFWTTTSAVIPCEFSILCKTDNAQFERVQQMRDEAIKAAEDARESAEGAEQSAKTAAECATRAENATVDVDKATEAAKSASASAKSANAAADRAEKATVDVDKATAAASSAATSATEAREAVNSVDNAFSQVNDLLKLLLNGGA